MEVSVGGRNNRLQLSGVRRLGWHLSLLQLLPCVTKGFSKVIINWTSCRHRSWANTLVILTKTATKMFLNKRVNHTWLNNLTPVRARITKHVCCSIEMRWSHKSHWSANNISRSDYWWSWMWWYVMGVHISSIVWFGNNRDERRWTRLNSWLCCRYWVQWWPEITTIIIIILLEVNMLFWKTVISAETERNESLYFLNEAFQRVVRCSFVALFWLFLSPVWLGTNITVAKETKWTKSELCQSHFFCRFCFVVCILGEDCCLFSEPCCLSLLHVPPGRPLELHKLLLGRPSHSDIHNLLRHKNEAYKEIFTWLLENDNIFQFFTLLYRMHMCSVFLDAFAVGGLLIII